MNYYKATVSYKGTGFFGWQKQPDQRTVQGELESLLAKISNCSLDKIQVIGSGRTDANVHANGQVVRLSTPKDLEPEVIKRAFNGLLDERIRLLEIERSDDSFQPVFGATQKEYHYYFSLDKNRSPFFYDLVTYIDGPISIERMRMACELFTGEHDFVNYSTTGTPVKSTVRTISSLTLEKIEQGQLYWPEETYRLVFKGNGFLKQMVRLITATIWSYAKEKIDDQQIKDSLSEKKEDKLAPTAPPNGLYLHKVTY